MKKNLLLNVLQYISKTIQEEQSQEDAYKKAVKNRVSRQAKIIDPTLN